MGGVAAAELCAVANHAALLRPLVFLVSGATFTDASVFMKHAGTNVALTLEAQAQGYGDNTIVWDPVGMPTSAPTADAVLFGYRQQCGGERAVEGFQL